jgi:hypothetical protein
MGRRRSAEVGQGRAVDARRDAGEHMIDRPGAIHFDPATELAIRRVRRSRPSFIFPNADRKSTSIGFGFIAVGVHAGSLSSNFIGRQAWTRLSPTSAFLILQLQRFCHLASPESPFDKSAARARRRQAHCFKTVLRRHSFVVFGVVPNAILL